MRAGGDGGAETRDKRGRREYGKGKRRERERGPTLWREAGETGNWGRRKLNSLKALFYRSPETTFWKRLQLVTSTRHTLQCTMQCIFGWNSPSS